MLAAGAALPALAAAAPQPRTESHITTPVDASVRVTLHGSVHPLANPQNDRGAVPDSTAMNRMLLVLKRSPNQDKALSQAIKEMEKPGSKTYHHWLTPEQIGTTYGPSGQDIAAVTGWLASSGFRVTSVSRAGSTVEFSGTAQQVASAFHTEIHSYAWNGKTYTANAQDPQIPAALAPVVAGFASLNNFPPKPELNTSQVVKFDKHSKSWTEVATAATDGKASPAGRPKSNLTFTDSNNGTTLYPVTPYDFATIYNVKPLWDAGVDGSGQQIAVIGLSDVAPSDVDQFRSSFGLPATRLNTVHGGDDPGATGDGYQVDATANVEWAGAIAKNATIDLVTTASTAASDGHYLSLTYAVDNIVAPVLADGNITCESALGPAGDLFIYQTWQQAAAEGITVVTSTGNSGSAACDIDSFSAAENGLAVNGFASTPFDVAVGGTDFSGSLSDLSKYWSSTNDPTTLASAVSYIPEIPWNSTCASPITFAAFGGTSGDPTPAQWCDDVNIPDQFPIDYLSPTEAAGGGASSCTNFNPAAYPSRAYCVSGYAKPDWQSGVNGVPADNARDVPDVSFFASTGLFKSSYLYCMSGSLNYQTVPPCDYSNPDSVEFFASGGTSFASSAFAGVMALVNQKTNSSQGLANYFLYSLAQQEYGSTSSPNNSQTNSCNASSGQESGNSCTYYDITAGSNAIPCAEGSPNCVGGQQEGPGGYIGIIPGYNSTPGYDPVTGLGSMNVTNLVNNWATVAAATQATTTTLAVSSTSSTYGLPITISGTVAPASGTGSPAGSVAIVGGLLNEASIPVVNGAFSQSVGNLSPGAYSIIASYVGDGGYQSSSSAPVSLVVAEATASTALTFTSTDVYSGGPIPITGNNIPYGENMVATMTVTDSSTAPGVAAPTGSVSFTSGGATLANQPLTNNAASFQTVVAQIGSYSLTAAYSGDANYNIGKPVTQTYNVVKAPTTISASTSASTVAIGSAVTVTANIVSTSHAVPPMGQVTFSLNGAAVGTATVTPGNDPITGAGIATASITLDASQIPAGNDVLTAVYSGDDHFLASTSSATPIVSLSGDAGTTLTMTASTTSATSNQPVTILATLTVNGTPVPLGSVQFQDNGKTISVVPVVGLNPAAGALPGTAKLVTRLTPGTHTILGIYSGAGNLLHPTGNVTPAITVTAAPQLTATKLTEVNNATIPADYDVTATVLAEGGTVPTGSVALNEPSLNATLNTVAIDPTQAALGVSPELPAASGSQNGGIVTGDFNGDGITDFAAASDSSATQLLVSLGNGDGTFQTSVGSVVTTDPTLTGANSVTTGDFNMDGITDIMMTFGSGNAAVVMLGNGDGTFKAGQVLHITPLQGSSVAYLGDIVTADFNGDGVQDVALTNDPEQGTGSIQIFFGNGDGTFNTNPTSLLSVATTGGISTQLHILTADVNGDGKADLVTFSHLDGTTGVLLGNGDGTFQTLVPYATGLGTRAGAVGDINNDNFLDIVAPIYDTGKVAVLINNHDGTFSGPQIFDAAYSNNGPPSPFPGPNSVALGDVNGDGNLDIVVADNNYNQVSVIYGNGKQSLANYYATTLINTAGAPTQVITGNLTGNGHAGILVNEPGSGTGTVGAMVYGSLWTAQFTNVAVYGGASEMETLSATYSGDSANTGSTSAVLTLAGSNSAIATKLDWTPGASTTVFGTPVPAAALNAQVEKSIPGSITYSAGLGLPVVSGTSLPAAGAYTLTATFTPTNSNDYAPSTATAAFSVSKANISQALTSSSSQADAGATLTLTDTVVSSTSGTPTGMVNFFSGTNSLGAAPLNASGVATLDIATLAAGTYSITANYLGDGNFNTGSSTPVSVTIGAPSITLAINSPALTVSAGATGSETLTVTPLNGYTGSVSLNCGNLPPGISCSFSPASATLGAAAVNATLTVATPTPSSSTAMLRNSSSGLSAAGGAVAIASALLLCIPGRRRRYPWLAVLLMTAAAAVTVGCGGSSSHTTAGPQATTLTLSSSAGKSASGSSVTFTAKLTGTNASTATGSVTFYDGATAIGQAAVSNGTAQLNLSTLAVGGHSISASYAGDSNDNPAGTASNIEQVITGQTSFTVTATSGNFSQTSNVSLTLQ
jgi:hypothetical protein